MHIGRRRCTLISVFILATVALDLPAWQAAGQSGPVITVSSSVPNELNPPFNPGPPSTGGAPAASPEQASAFAWQEFIALNWPAGPQAGQPNQREAPSTTCKFGDPSAGCKLLVWQTMRGKAEIFPGDSNPPPGFVGSSAATSWGYDSLPAYDYALPVLACDMKQANDPTPWINLDETDQILLDNMYAGVVDRSSSPGNSSPQLIRFLAKANRSQYVYVAGNSDPNNFMNQWWNQNSTGRGCRDEGLSGPKQGQPASGKQDDGEPSGRNDRGKGRMARPQQRRNRIRTVSDPDRAVL